jgi:hypothetical protein
MQPIHVAFSYSLLVTPKKKKEEAPELTKNLTFWTVAPMVDRRPQMWRSHQNATILLFTCLIQMSDESRMNSLFFVVGCLGFFYKNIHREPSFTVLSPRAPPPSPRLLPFKEQGGRQGGRRIWEFVDRGRCWPSFPCQSLLRRWFP